MQVSWSAGKKLSLRNTLDPSTVGIVLCGER